MHRIAFLAVVFVGFALTVVAGNDLTDKIADAKKQLEPKAVSFQGEVFVGDYLTALAKQTGNLVVDRRQNKTKEPLKLDFDKVGFWQALDRFTLLAGCGYTAYSSDGGIALVDGQRRSPQVSYHGITRTALKRVNLVGDLETGTAQCILHLDVAWEPRFEPFYLGVGPATALYTPRGVAKELKAQAPARGQMPVAGRSASEVEIQLPAPPRQSPSIVSLEGSFKFLGPSKMLKFTFKGINADAVTKQEEISVRIAKVKAGPDRWRITLDIENPEGTPEFESFQSWLDNNRVTLVGLDGDVARWIQPEPNETVDVLTARKAVIEYAFAAPKRSSKPANWTLEVRTPGRIVELTVPFRFENVPLP